MMTVSERINDISRRSGFSEKIIRSVLDAERASVIDSLKKGEKATMIGRATLVPTVRNKLNCETMTLGRYVAVTAKPASVIKAEMEKLQGYEKEDEVINPNISVKQIASLV